MIEILIWQVVIMFILVAVGLIMFKTGKITNEGSKTLGNILIFLSLPCVIINGFFVERDSTHLWGLLYSAIAAAVIMLISIVISALFFKKDPIASFASAFSNPGFFGVPLIVASLSDGAVFYIASFIAFVNLLQWTYGVAIITKGEDGKKETVSGFLKRLIKAPFMIAIIIGLIFFLFQIPRPVILTKCIVFLKELNTPIAMFTVGVYLAQTDVVRMFKKPKLYLLTVVRLIIIPAVSMIVLMLVPNEMMDLKMAILIAIACPVGSNVAVYAQLHNKDYAYAVETVIISTLFSIITIPGIVWIAQQLFALVSM